MNRLAAGVLALLVLASVAPSAQDAERLFKAAINTEMVDGNLKAAIEQYRKVAASGNRALAAQALLRMAECYQKLGDAEAQKIYQRLARDYADQTEAAAVARARLSRGTAPPNANAAGTANRRVWSPGADPSFGTVSADGRYLSYTDWSTGDLFVRDFTTGRNRRVTNKGPFSQSSAFAEESAISRDGRYVAYSWWGTVDGKGNYELRTAPLDGNGLPESRLLVRNDDIGWLAPTDWSPDGKWIAVMIARVDRTDQLGLVSARDGSLQILKSNRWRGASEIFFSPDGKYLAFDSPTGDAQEPSDVYVLAIDGSRETPAVVSPSHEILMGWSPDGRQLLFASDRGGTMGLWAQPMLDGRPTGAPRMVKPDLAPAPLGVTSTGTLFLRASASEQDLFVANVDFDTGKVIGAPVSPVQRYVGTNRTPAWSRDGNLAYVSLRNRIGTNQQVTLVIQSLETGETRELDVPQLNYFQNPNWAPDGRTLLVRGAHVNGKGGIHRVDARTGDVRTIAEAGVGVQESADGKLYYRSLKSETNEAALIENDLTTGARRELFSAASMTLPALSADGRTIAVIVSDRSRQRSTLLLIPVNGDSVRELAQISFQQTDTRPAWTPDGRRIVIRKTQGDGTPELWVVPVDGSPHHKIDLAGPIGNHFAIHPDGRRLAYLAGERKGEVWVLENFLSTTPNSRSDSSSTTLATRRVLEQGAPWDRISPDGRFLARVDNVTSNLQLLDLATGRTRALTHDGNPEDPDHRYPLASAFSRDGARIAYQWEFEKDDRSVLRVVSTAEQGPATVRTVYDNADVSLAPTDWSPDGRWIAAVIRRKDHTAQIGVVGVADGSLRVLKTVDWSRVGGLRFSPDSSLLAYHKPAAEGRFDRDVFVIAVDGSKEYIAAASPGDDVVLEWEPTGQRLLVASDRGGSMSVWSVAGTVQAQPTTFELVKSDVGIVSSLGPTRDGSLFYNLLPTGSTTYVAQFDAAKGQLSSAPIQPIQQFKGFNSGGQWSSDGKYLVYASRRDIPAPINVTRVVVPFVSMTTGTVERELLPALSYGNLGRLSPDGRQFIVRGADLKGRSGILSVDARTGEATLVVPNETCSGVPYWAADGQSFFCYREKQIVQVELSSGAVRRTFAADSQGASASPDGQYIVYGDARSSGLKLLALATGATRDLIRLPPPSSRVGNSGSIEWTPDSQAVVFYGRVNGDEGMWLTPIDGRAPHKINVAVGPISSWHFNATTGQVVFSTATGFGRLETWKMENFLPKQAGISAKR
jgi:Tol biopolymer transport system component